MYRTFKKLEDSFRNWKLIRTAAEVVGYKDQRGGRKGSAWWKDEENDAIK